MDKGQWTKKGRNKMCDDAMTARGFGLYVAMIMPCVYRERGSMEHAKEVLRWFDCPEEWLWPVIVMARGANYCGADAWMTEFTRPQSMEE